MQYIQGTRAVILATGTSFILVSIILVHSHRAGIALLREAAVLGRHRHVKPIKSLQMRRKRSLWHRNAIPARRHGSLEGEYGMQTRFLRMIKRLLSPVKNNGRCVP